MIESVSQGIRVTAINIQLGTSKEYLNSLTLINPLEDKCNGNHNKNVTKVGQGRVVLKYAFLHIFKNHIHADLTYLPTKYMYVYN